MRILVDRHHSDLLYSLQLLFEDRLGFELFVPTGREWWDNGVWRFGEVYGDDRLVRQFLEAPNHRAVEPGLYIAFDQSHPERPIYEVTYERARTMQWDGVMATVQENQKGFAAFASEVGARYFYHIGNARQQVDWSLSPTVLDASGSAGSEAIPICEEFDASTFRYRPPSSGRIVTSFVNLLAGMGDPWTMFRDLGSELPGYTMQSYGHGCPDGFLTPVAAVAEEMARATWAYHDKPTGDGFGHVIHCWAAIGRPLIGHARYYKGQRAEPLWQDGTCIDLDRYSIPEAALLISNMSFERYERMCRTIRRVFDSIYTPIEDARKLASLLSL